MELTELYIEAGYPYDNFFGRNWNLKFL
jgi:hypothetical protein